MRINKTSIPGCVEIIPPVFKDERGSFIKTFHEHIFAKEGLETHFAEEYYSVSNKGVIRGLHFQTPPHHHTKMVYCVYGAAFDAVVDLRAGSPAYGKFEVFNLSAEKGNIVYIPAGLAHGFYAMSQQTIMLYKVSTVYSPENDSGVLWDSAGIPWPGTARIVSKRDGSFPPLAQFTSPFVFGKE